MWSVIPEFMQLIHFFSLFFKYDFLWGEKHLTNYKYCWNLLPISAFVCPLGTESLSFINGLVDFNMLYLLFFRKCLEFQFCIQLKQNMVKSYSFYCIVSRELQSEFFNNLTTMTKNFTILKDIGRILHFYTFFVGQ